MSQHPMEYTTPQSDQQHTPVNTPLPRNMLTANDPNQDSSPADTASSQRQVKSFTPCVRKNDRFVDPSGKPLQPGTIIICDKIPFVVSNNGKIYNFTGCSFKQLYITDPSEHKFLVSLANSPSTFSSIINSVISLLPRFGGKQSNTNKTIKKEKQTVIEAINTSNSNVELNVSSDAIADMDVSDSRHLSAGKVHCELHHNPSQHENLFPDIVRNEMLTQYNHIVIGSFKEFFQHIDMNNLAEVLKALRELNFILVNRAPELALYYNIELEPRQIIAEEVPNLVRAHFNSNTVYNTECSTRGRPCSKGNQCHWYSQQLLLILRYHQHSERSDNHFYSNRNYGNTYHHTNSQHNSPHTVRNSPGLGNDPVNVVAAQSPNKTNKIESFQSEILGLKTQALQQSTLNSIKTFNRNNKNQWAQSVENAAKLCNLDTLTIALSKLQGPPLQLAHFLKTKERSSGK